MLAQPQGVSGRKPSKLPLFAFEALGALACGFYGNYIFFLFRDRHEFGNLGNLGIAALMGAVITVSSWQGGRFAQRFGCYRAMYLGLIGMIMALACGAVFHQLAVQLIVLIVWTASQFIIWPSLEALVVDEDNRKSRARTVGIYNVVWASCAALSYFFGGSLFEQLGSGSIYWLPPAFHLAQIIILRTISRRPVSFIETAPLQKIPESEPGPNQSARRLFQKMAWFANPFACVAAFTLLAMIPELARRMGYGTTFAGWICSIWFFARLIAFIVLWKWDAWHYRFSWLLGGYLALMAGFGIILTARDSWWLGGGQILFGLAVGLLYYSSLFYSMDVGEERARNGGIHESLMGAGSFIGPGIAALSLIVAPQTPQIGVWSVSGLLATGLAGLLGFRFRSGHPGVKCKQPK